MGTIGQPVIRWRYIDWEKTGKKLKLLRTGNLSLRRYVCRALGKRMDICDGDCAACQIDMDPFISREELALTFSVSVNKIYNWETGKTPVSLEDMFFYSSITGLPIEEIVVFESADRKEGARQGKSGK